MSGSGIKREFSNCDSTDRNEGIERSYTFDGPYIPEKYQITDYASARAGDHYSVNDSQSSNIKNIVIMEPEEQELHGEDLGPIHQSEKSEKYIVKTKLDNIPF